jgi:sulfofructose kinase
MNDVWVLGSASWDRVYEIDQIPAAGGRATARCLGRRAGGSTGNVARALGSAGHRVRLVAQVGADDLGAALLEELATWGVATDSVLRYGTCTPETLIFVDERAERTIVVLDKHCAKAVPAPYAAMADADGVFIGRYADFEPQLPTVLRQSSALVVTAVPAPEDTSGWFAHLVIGSCAEYPTSWLSAPYEELRRRVGPQLQWVVVTQGKLGATAYGPASIVRIPPVDAVVRDTTGAGDSFAAGLLHGLLQGHDMGTAGRLGACWAAAALRLPQSVPPRWAQLALGSAAGDWATLLAGDQRRDEP